LNPFVTKEGLDAFALMTVFVALIAAGFCSCVMGNGGRVKDGRTTVVVTGPVPLGLITDAGGLVEV
jgi:hypothetical protein